MPEGELAIETHIDPMRAIAMHAALGRPSPAPGVGDALPAFWHWSQFWAIEPPERLGRDGHPAHGTFLPETGLPRRMWAGGAVVFHQPVIIGDRARRVSWVGDVTRKQGRSGPLAFLEVTHRVFQGDVLCIEERQDLVFRAELQAGAAPRATETAQQSAVHQREFQPDSVELFRYSALTFNGHRIHYDAAYAHEVEGYDGLVVHGPLLAQRLLDLAQDQFGPARTLTFRALAPVLHPQRFVACAAMPADGAVALWIEREDGALAMRAEVSLAGD